MNHVRHASEIWLGLACLWGCATLDPKAVRALGKDPAALIAAYEETDRADVRIAVVESLADHPDEARSVLERALASSDPEERVAAVGALRNADLAGPYGAALVTALSDAWPAVGERAVQIFTERGESARERLLWALESGGPIARRVAARRLGRLAPAPPTTQALLKALIDDEVPVVRAEAAEALGHLANPSVARPLAARLVEEPDPLVRSALAATLSKLPNAARVPVLVWPIRNQTGDDKLAGPLEEIRRRLVARLAAAGVCQVVDEGQLTALIEHWRKAGDLRYDGDAPELPGPGKVPIAEQIVHGSLLREGDRLRVILVRIDAATAVAVPGTAVEVLGEERELARLGDEAIGRLIDRWR